MAETVFDRQYRCQRRRIRLKLSQPVNLDDIDGAAYLHLFGEQRLECRIRVHFRTDHDEQIRAIVAVGWLAHFARHLFDTVFFDFEGALIQASNEAAEGIPHNYRNEDRGDEDWSDGFRRCGRKGWSGRGGLCQQRWW